MPYNPPIEIEYGEPKIIEGLEDRIMYAVEQAVEIRVHKEDLIRALQYDRHQYERGYEDGQREAEPQKWIPCAERMPEIGTDVIVYAVRKDCLGDAVTTITRYINYIWFGHRIDTEPYWNEPWQYFHSNYEITHWMPLPDAPEVET